MDQASLYTGAGTMAIRKDREFELKTAGYWPQSDHSDGHLVPAGAYGVAGRKFA